MNIIVIGGSGNIGKLLVNGARGMCHTVGTSTSGSDSLVKFDLAAPRTFDFGQLDNQSVVYVTAAISSPDICANDPALARGVNVTGTSEFIGRSLDRGARIVFFSSDVVYGQREDSFDEAAECNAVGPYGEMKRSIEAKFASVPEFKAIRLSYVFSRDDKFTSYLVSCSQDGKTAEVFNSLARAVVHRGDVIDGALALATRWNEFTQPVINFGGPEVITRTEFAAIVQTVALPGLEFRCVEPSPEFFHNRPRVINMLSPILPDLLGRASRTVQMATRSEFNLN